MSKTPRAAGKASRTTRPTLRRSAAPRTATPAPAATATDADGGADAGAGAGKRPFELDEMFQRIAEAVAPYPRAAMFELAERGFGSVFHILIGCILSIRTRDEVSLPAALKLFAAAPTPAALARLTPQRIDPLIRACSFHAPKSKQIHAIAKQTVADFAGILPCDAAVLTRFRGVGPKCANLALGVACGEQAGLGISVDIHVHRVTNRWGLVQTGAPEQTMKRLQTLLPRRWWVQANALLVPFGKHICTGRLPRCTTCPVIAWCRQIGVTQHR